MSFFFEDELVEDQAPQSEIPRHLGRGAARAAEAALGLPGDLMNLPLELGGGLAKLLGAPEGSVEKAKDITKQIVPAANLPGSEDIREQFTERFTGEALQPQTRGEEIGDEIIGDAVSIFLPAKGAKGLKSVRRLLRSLGIAGGATGAAELAGKFGAGEKGKTATKLGSMLFLSSLGMAKPRQLTRELYSQAEEAIKEGASVPASKMKNQLFGLRNSLKKGLEAPTEKAVLDKIEKLDGKIKRGKIGVDELWASKRSLNEELGRMLGEAKTRPERVRAKKLYKRLNGILNEELGEYAEKNPQFGKPFKEAEEAFGTLAQSELVGNFIRNHARYTPSSVLLYPLLHAFPMPGAATGIASVAGYKGGQLAYRLLKSPTLRKYYTKVLKDAAAEDSKALNRSLRQLDKKLVEEFPDSTDRYVFED